jgi:hypothetical protein|eukprot:COSAG01_NODE_7396_length_3224_cov_2.790250_5_plen_87_part_00
MKACSVRPPDCDPNVEYLGGAPHCFVALVTLLSRFSLEVAHCSETHTGFDVRRCGQLWFRCSTTIFFIVPDTGAVRAAESLCRGAD